jgi:hypothetical protein
MAVLFLVPVAVVTVTALWADAQDDAAKAAVQGEPFEAGPPTPAQTAEQTQEKPVGDQDNLQGTWRVVEFVVDGKPAQRQNPTDEANMVVKGDQMWMVVLPADKKIKGSVSRSTRPRSQSIST